MDPAQLGESLNCRVPDFTRTELIAALLELVKVGDIEVVLERRRVLLPNAVEIDAGIGGAVPMAYQLTPQGGDHWARIAGVDWKIWDLDNWSTSNFGSITTGDREFTEFLLEKEVRKGNVYKLVAWKEVRPWKPVDWHQEPVGYQVRYRLASSKKQAPGPRFPAGWNTVSVDPRPTPGLSPRWRRPGSAESRPLQALSEKQLQTRLIHRDVLMRLAAATELGRRSESSRLLMELLVSRCPAVRFAAARALGHRKSKQAVPALLGALFRNQDVAVAEALGIIGDPRALGPLLPIFTWWPEWSWGSEARFFEAVTRAIGQHGDMAVKRLEKLARKRPELGYRIRSTLGRSTSVGAVQILLGEMSDHFRQVTNLLCRMGDAAREHVFRIAADERGADGDRATAARALADSCGVFQEEGRRIVDALRQYCGRRAIAFAVTGDSEKAVDDPVRDLTALLQHPSCAKRRAAIEYLGQLGAEDAAPAIAPLSNDERWEVRASVARVLARWGKPAEALDRLRQDPDIIVRGYARGFT